MLNKDEIIQDDYIDMEIENENIDFNDGGKKKMDGLTKALLYLLSGAVIVGTSLGIVVYQTDKENKAKEVAQQGQVIEVKDNSKTDLEKQIDQALNKSEKPKNKNTKPKEEIEIVGSKIISDVGNGSGADLSAESLEIAQADEADATDEDIIEEQTTNVSIEKNDVTVVTKSNTTKKSKFTVDEIKPKTLYAKRALNIRKGPSVKDYKKVGVIKANQKVTVVGVVKVYKGETVLWYKLKDNKGYVHGGYLTDRDPSKQKTEATTTESSNSSSTKKATTASSKASNGSTGSGKTTSSGSNKTTTGSNKTTKTKNTGSNNSSKKNNDKYDNSCMTSTIFSNKELEEMYEMCVNGTDE